MSTVTKKRVSGAFQTVDVRSALMELVRGFGHDPTLINPTDLQEIADRLSSLAGKDPPWGYLYLHNILRNNMEPGRKLTAAIFHLGAVMDGVPPLQAQARPVNVFAIGNVKPGAIVLVDSRRCKLETCPIHFIPRSHNQEFCTPEHRKKYKKIHKKEL